MKMPRHIYNTIKFKKEDREKFTKYMKGGNLDFNKIIPMPKEFDKMGGDHGEVEEIAKEWKEFTKDVEITGLNVDKYIKKFRNAVKKNPEKYPESAKSVNLKTIKNEWEEVSVPNFQYQMYRTAGEVKYGFSSWYDWSISNWGTKWNACKTDLDEECLFFKTAWSTPLPIFRKIAELNPDTWFQVEYCDEFDDENSGIIEYKPKFFPNEKDNMAVVKYGTAGLDIIETGFFDNLEEAPKRFNAVIETSGHGTFIFCN